MNWDLTYLYPTIKDWDEGYNKTVELVKKLHSFKGKLGEFESFKEYFLLQLKFSDIGLRTYQYASLLSDLNKKNAENSTINSKDSHEDVNTTNNIDRTIEKKS